MVLRVSLTRDRLVGIARAAGLNPVLRVMAAVVLFGVGTSGCQPDTRMSVDEFLAIQRMQGMPPATSQPVGSQPAAVAASRPALAPWDPGPYRVGPGDVLTISISGMEKLGLPSTYTPRVRDNGEVILPSVGGVFVDGLTLDELEDAIRAAYMPKYVTDTQVIAKVAEYKMIGVVVLGDLFRSAVGRYQAIELRKDRASVLHALMAAGSPRDFGGRVTLVPARAPDQLVVFDLNELEDQARAARIGSIREADVLIVDARENDAVYVQGLVNRPGPILLTRGATLSVLQAIGAAGGTLLAFEPHEATLMRRQESGELFRVKVDLDRIKLGQDPDLALAAGDVLILPHNAATRVEEFIARSFTLRIGTGVETTYNPWTEYYLRRDAELNNNGDGFFDSLTSQLTNQLGNLVTPTPAAAP